MKEAKNIKTAHKLGTKRNRLLIVCAMISPFVTIFLDSAFLERRSFFEENITSHINNNLPAALCAWILYLMMPSFIFIGLVKVSVKIKFILFLCALLILFPLSLTIFVFVGMGLYNVYP